MPDSRGGKDLKKETFQDPMQLERILRSESMGLWASLRSPGQPQPSRFASACNTIADGPRELVLQACCRHPG